MRSLHEKAPAGQISVAFCRRRMMMRGFLILVFIFLHMADIMGDAMPTAANDAMLSLPPSAAARPHEFFKATAQNRFHSRHAATTPTLSLRAGRQLPGRYLGHRTHARIFIDIMLVFHSTLASAFALYSEISLADSPSLISMPLLCVDGLLGANASNSYDDAPRLTATPILPAFRGDDACSRCDDFMLPGAR